MATPNPIDMSRVMIHADNLGCDGGTRPQWTGQGQQELSTSPFAEKSEADDEMTEINSRLERMLDKAPSDSTANLLVRKTKDGSYKAFLRIRSVNKRFAGFIRGSRFIDVVENVISDVRSQIDEWKKQRPLAEEPV